MTITELATQPTPILPVTFIWPAGEDIADLEVTDAVIISDTLEQIDIGGGGVLPRLYLRLSGPDLVAAAGELHRLADRITNAVFEARDERADAARHDCWCGVRLEADELDCGSPRCARTTAKDNAGLIP